MPQIFDHPKFRPGTRLVLALCAGLGAVCAQTTVADWQKEAVRKYPELGRAGSKLNKKFTDAANAARVSRPELFNDPQWPMLLADEISVPPAPPAPGADPLLLGNKRVATVQSLAEASTKKLEAAVQTRNAAQISVACQQFIHASPVLRAQAKTLGQTTTEAAHEMVAAAQFARQSQAEIARLRRNAAQANIPNSLSPNDPEKQKHAMELADSADALEKKVADRTATAKQSFENCLENLRTLILKAREPEETPPR